MRIAPLSWIAARVLALANLLAPRGCVACGEPVALALCDLCAVSLLDAPRPPARHPRRPRARRRPRAGGLPGQV